MARLREEINNLPVSEHLVFMLQSLSSLAMDRLGLVPEAVRGATLEQARLAIDAFKALLDVVEQARPAAEIVGLQEHALAAADGLRGSAGRRRGARDAEAPTRASACGRPGRRAAPSPSRRQPEEPAAPQAKAAPKKAANYGGAKGSAVAAGAKGARRARDTLSGASNTVPKGGTCQSR